MGLQGYTYTVGKTLRRMQIPHINNRIGLRLLWVDSTWKDELDGISFEKTHFHSFFELHFVYGGSIIYECRGKNIEISDNGVMFISPNEPHRCIAYTDDIKKLTLAFSVENTREAQPIFKTEGMSVYKTTDKINSEFEDVLLAVSTGGVLTPAVVAGKIYGILDSIFEIMDIKLPIDDGSEADSRVIMAKRFIKNNLHRPISTEEVALECCLSPKQLGRIFFASEGCSVFTYVTNERVEYVKSLLLTKKYSVKEISYMTGFENVGSFVLFFKRHAGKTPGSYMKEN